MSSFLLVHGAWHGAWCWQRVTPLLEARGHRVVAFDLPGHGSDPTPAQSVSLQDYARCVSEAIADQREAPFVVGHSMGGLVISQAAEQAPERVRGLIYLCAYLPTSDQSLGMLALRDQQSLVVGALDVDSETGLSRISADLARRAFYNDCQAEEVRWAHAQLGCEPLHAFEATVSLSEARFGRVPRAYIYCELDAVIGPALQREMEAASPCRVAVSMQTGHSPFLSAPQELARHLESIAQRLSSGA